jgi:hypothetical protein
MLLNFKHENGLLSLPDLSCLKKTGPGDSIFIINIKIGNSQGNSRTIIRKEKHISKIFFMIRFNEFSKGSRLDIKTGVFS